MMEVSERHDTDADHSRTRDLADNDSTAINIEGKSYSAFDNKERAAHEWYQYFKSFRRPVEGHTGRATNPVKVAVLDTGVDKSLLTGPSAERIKESRSFLPAGGGDDPSDHHDVPGPHGHGTHVVSLILDSAPWVEVYSARIKKDDESPIDPECVAQAIQYAVSKWNVHIISMSWGFKQVKPEHKSIEEAIILAYDRKTIMFAAASNEGANLPFESHVTFPANMPEVICINASDGHGNKSSFNPPPREADFNFSTLGEAILVSHSPQSVLKTRQSGTSFATPIAASIAATLIEFASQKDIVKSSPKLKERVATPDGMIKLLAAMSQNQQDGFRYLLPWSLIRCKHPGGRCKCKDCRREALVQICDIMEGDLPNPGDSLASQRMEQVDPVFYKAAFNASSGDADSSVCLPGTRTSVLSDIRRWVDGETSSHELYCLDGMAGNGKTTIARTICHEYHVKKRLVASFFFTRGQGDLSSTRKFAPAISAQLCDFSWEFRQRVTTSHPSRRRRISNLSFQDQWKELVLEPLSHSRRSRYPDPLLLVVDSLDQCDNQDHVRSLMEGLAELTKLPAVQLRVLVTSRPSQPLSALIKIISRLPHQGLSLQNVDRALVTHDIAVYYRHKLDDLLHHWGTGKSISVDDTIRRLSEKSGGLFIHAALVCRFIAEGGQLAGDRLSAVIAAGPSPITPERGLDDMYTTVLRSSLPASLEPGEAERCRDLFCIVVGSIVMLFDEMSPNELALLIGKSGDRDIANMLNCHRSVINVPNDPGRAISLLHPSFRDFLVDPDRCLDRRFTINAAEVHKSLLGRCLELMQGHLGQDMCRLNQPGMRARDVSRADMSERLPDHIQYACLYWIRHLAQSNPGASNQQSVVDFFQCRFLFWLEALSLMGRLADGVELIQELEGIVERMNPTDAPPPRLLASFRKINIWGGREGAATNKSSLILMISDAKRFLLTNFSIIAEAPLQVYYSALVFSPKTSVTRMTYNHLIPKCISPCKYLSGDWDEHSRLMNKHPPMPRVEFLAEGKILASVSSGGTVRLWDMATGTGRRIMARSWFHTASAFSPDGATLMWIDDNSAVQVWDMAKMSRRFALTDVGHTWLTTVVFSPDGRTIAAGGRDGILQLWDVERHEKQRGAKMIRGWITVIAFSADSHVIAAASKAGNILVWDRRADNTDIKMPTHDGSEVRSILFSREGTLLLSLSVSGTAELWVSETGRRCHLFNDEKHFVTAVAFSPDGRLAAIGTRHGPIQVWDIEAGTELRFTLTGHSGGIRAVEFSRDGSYLASASDDGISRLWNVEFGTESRALECPVNWTSSIVFSPDSLTLATASDDGAVWLWDVASEDGRCVLEGLAAVNEAIFSPSYTFMASTDLTRVNLYNAATGESQVLMGHSYRITAVAFSPNEALLVTASEDGTARLWDTKRGKCRELKRHSREYTAQHWSSSSSRMKSKASSDGFSVVSFSPDGSIVATAACSGVILLWGAKGGEGLGALRCQDRVEACVFSPDGKLLAAACGDGVVRIYNVKTREIEHVAALDHSLRATTVAFSPNGKVIAIAANDGAIRLWNVQANMADAESRVIAGHPPKRITAICFSPDCLSLASTATDGTVRLWDTGTCLESHVFNLDMTLRDLTFSPCGNYLITDWGSLGLLPSGAPSNADSTQVVFAGRDWITRDGKDLILMPPGIRRSLLFVMRQSLCFRDSQGGFSVVEVESEG